MTGALLICKLVPEGMLFCVSCRCSPSWRVTAMPRTSSSFELPTAATPAAQSSLQLYRPVAATTSVTLTYHCPLGGCWGLLSPCFLAPALLPAVYLFRQDRADAGRCTCALNVRPGPQRAQNCRVREDGCLMHEAQVWKSDQWWSSSTPCASRRKLVFCTSSHWIPRTGGLIPG